VSGPGLNVRIDELVCQGTAYCVRVAPKVFQVDDELGRVIDPHPADDQEDLVVEAATLCPSRAITY
jgi:ferredoxin